MAAAAEARSDAAIWQRRGGYPLFTDPEQYLALRDGGRWLGPVKRYVEERAIDRCLAGLPDIRTVIDAPCGPGRLFPYWQKRGWSVTGVDLSLPMVTAAGQWQHRNQVPWQVVQGDAFHLREASGSSADLVVCVRFCYYFDRPRRVELLRSLALASRRYVMVQYKTWTTFKGRVTSRRTRREHGLGGKQFCSLAEIAQEVREAGLVGLRIRLVGPFSDRVFVAAQVPP